MTLSVDNREVRNYSNRLRQMHRSNFPIVVRQTLNDLAFDVKKNTLLPSADKAFILRNPTFFKKFSGVQKASGFEINRMKSEVGINSSNSVAARQLTQQEYGGRIPKRSMIYMDQARVGKSKSKMVRKANYIGTKKIVRGQPDRQRSQKSQFVADAYIAKRYGLFLLTDNTLFDVNDIKFGKGKARKVFVRLTPIADYEKNRSVSVSSTYFLKKASQITYQKQTSFFIKNAKRRLEKK
jgi:hypothetical protein